MSRRVHRCDICGRFGNWGPGWAQFGTADQTEAIVCSEECRRRHVATLPAELDTWIGPRP